MKQNISIVLAIVLCIMMSMPLVWATSSSAEQNAAITASGTTASSYATAIGYQTQAIGEYSFATGRLTIANEMDSFAAGYRTFAGGNSSTALGYLTNATGNYSTAMGANTTANGTYATAIGYNSQANGNTSVAIGREIIVRGDFSVGIGLDDFGVPPVISGSHILGIIGGNVGIGLTNPLSRLAVYGLPNSSPDVSGVDGMVCITNAGNMWVDDDGTYDCA